ncbi:MAG: hypothetical protein GY764_00035 [Halieaceae bacterium]|nr:hypothetical protein [Halieaceae bacterium]
MPGKSGVLLPQCPHPIVRRGHNRQAVVLADEDYQFDLENLQEWKSKPGIKVYAWCLMANHVHLVAEPGPGASVLAEMMKRLAGRQAACIKKREERHGALWEGRFKAGPTQRDACLQRQSGWWAGKINTSPF